MSRTDSWPRPKTAFGAWPTCLGSVCPTSTSIRPCLSSVSISVRRDSEYLVFYRPTIEGIEIVRVLHGARDIPSILAEDFAIADETETDVREGGEDEPE